MSIQDFAIAIKARSFLRSLGGKVAGGYLRNRGVSFEKALDILGMPHRDFA